MNLNLKMNRYVLIPAMIPVMLILWGFVLRADHLHAWKYLDNFAPPTQSDYTFAKLAFFISLLTPVLIGFVAAIVGHRKKCQACWPVLETVIVASIYLIFLIGVFFPNLAMTVSAQLAIGIAGASCLVGGVIVVVLLNLAACIRQRKWGKLTNSAMVFLGGMLYLFWLYAFIIYVDT